LPLADPFHILLLIDLFVQPSIFEILFPFLECLVELDLLVLVVVLHQVVLVVLVVLHRVVQLVLRWVVLLSVVPEEVLLAVLAVGLLAVQVVDLLAVLVVGLLAVQVVGPLVVQVGGLRAGQ